MKCKICGKQCEAGKIVKGQVICHGCLDDLNAENNKKEDKKV